MTPQQQAELDRIEQEYSEGVTSAQLFELLQNMGVKMSEPTFRKYVQLGLLPRSRRVGQKGKHKGSQGVYPVSTIGRIIEIKALMEGDLTLEEIANGVLRFRAQLDQLDEALLSLIDAFIEEVRRPGMPETTRRLLSQEVEGLARSGDDLIKRAKELEARLADHGKKEDNIAPVVGLRKI
jgi:hypothetical protein